MAMARAAADAGRQSGDSRKTGGRRGEIPGAARIWETAVKADLARTHGRNGAHSRKPRLIAGAFNFNWATSYSPTHLARAVPSGLRGLTSVFGMGTGGTPSLKSPKTKVAISPLVGSIRKRGTT